MSNIGKNIKKIRAVKKLSQAKFAELFNLARPSVGAYEEGRSEPKIDTLIQISTYFKIKIDHLLSKEVTVNEIHGFDIFKNKALTQGKNKNIEHYLLLVSKEEYERYPQFHDQKEYLNNLPTMLIPKFSGQNHRAFELNSEAMNSILGLRKGNLILCEETNIENLKKKELTVLVSKDEILLGRVNSWDDKKINLFFDNPLFEPFTMDLKKIVEIWTVKGFFSTEIPECNYMNKKIQSMEEKITYLLDKVDK